MIFQSKTSYVLNKHHMFSINAYLAVIKDVMWLNNFFHESIYIRISRYFMMFIRNVVCLLQTVISRAS